MNRKCHSCQTDKILDKSNFHRHSRNILGFSYQCKECAGKVHKKWYKINGSKIKKARRQSNLELDRWKSAKYRAKLKNKIISHYSNNKIKCACQGCSVTEIEFLTIDHINGGGNKHKRQENMKGGSGLYKWLIKNNYPDGFQVLCYNCNCANIDEMINKTKGPRKSGLLRQEAMSILHKLTGWFTMASFVELIPRLKGTSKQNAYLLLKYMVRDSILEKKKLSEVSVLYRVKM
jgi:hypothetical protein